MNIKLRILRFNPETDRKGHWEEYNLEADPDERILDLLHKVKWFDDGSLAFRRSCAHGVCGSDAMVVNGENAKIFRSEESLTKQTKILSDLRERYQNVTISDKGKVFNTELLEAIELEYLLDMSDTTVASALERKESRGAHSRVDHIERDDSNWLKHSFAFKNGDSVKLDYKDVELGNYEPKERKY